MCIRNLNEAKIRLRKRYKLIRKNIIPEKKKLMDKKIIQKLFLLDIFQESQTVLLYISKDLEVSTEDIIKECKKRKKRIAVPKCDSISFNMKFYYINLCGDLKKGIFGIYEPSEDICCEVEDLSKGLCIVPGLCFDIYGYRLGYGKGYYDRFLSIFKGFKIGLCYSNCINFKLPIDKYDKAVDVIITDENIKKIYIKNRNYY